MGKSLKDNLRMAILARAENDQAVKARMDSMSAASPSKATEQTGPADESNRPVQQRSSTEEPNRRIRQLNPTPQQTSSADKQSSPVRQTNSADQQSRPVQQTSSTDHFNRQVQQTESTDQTSRPGSDTLPIRIGQRPGIVTPAQKNVLEYFQRVGSHISTYRIVAKETGVAHGTVRCVIDKLVNMGFLRREPWGKGSYRALRFLVCDPTEQTNSTDQFNRQTQQAIRADQLNRLIQQTNSTEEFHRGTQQTLKIDRENLSISLSAERIALTWPCLARSGFGPDQLAQIGHALAELGKPKDKVLQSLDHAEWELAEGKMLDKDGQPVADPCSWVFRSLARTGYYRRPKGYVSPEEQAIKDAETEAKAVTAARHATEQAQFEAWRDGLSPDELSDAMRGHPGGPKDAWLKKVWKERRK